MQGKSKTLFVAWQDPKSRQWAPVGQLSRSDNLYHFVYTQGVAEMGNFIPFCRMTDIKKEYISEELFPLFANRILAKSRPEYKDYLKWLGMSESTYDSLDELARTGGVRSTDLLELFPCPQPSNESTYNVYFFGHGLRYLYDENQKRALSLKQGDELYIMSDIQNEFDEKALLLRTGDPVMLVGYAPKYYSAEFSQLIKKVGASEIKVVVARINVDAPLQFRMLCKITSPWPADFEPCNKNLFKPLA